MNRLYEIWEDGGISTVFESEGETIDDVLNDYCKDAGYKNYKDACKMLDWDSNHLNVKLSQDEISTTDTMDEQEFITYMNRYARNHYEQGGWDEVVEAWSDGDFLEYYSDAGGDARKALQEIAKIVKLRYEYAQEIRSTAF